jgi:hypothetical protein
VRRRPAADRVLEEDVRRERTVSFDDEREVVGGVPGCLERLDRQPAGLERPLTISTPYRSTSSASPATWSGWRVRRQQVRHVQALALDDLVQRLERRAAVDEDRRAAGSSASR